MSGTAPSGTVTVRVMGLVSITQKTDDFLGFDSWCVYEDTATPTASQEPSTEDREFNLRTGSMNRHGGAINALDFMNRNDGKFVTFTPTDAVVPFIARGILPAPRPDDECRIIDAARRLHLPALRALLGARLGEPTAGVVRRLIGGNPSRDLLHDVEGRVIDRLVLAQPERLGDLLLVEGAGSPAEVNLRDGDIANMGFARAAGVPVLLVGDIERGGVIAQIVGTQTVLEEEDAALIGGFAGGLHPAGDALAAAAIAALARGAAAEAALTAGLSAAARIVKGEG